MEKTRVYHLRSNQTVNGKPKLPLSDQLGYGEIAINYSNSAETIAIKNELGDVKTFSCDELYTRNKLGSAFTGANNSTTVTDLIIGHVNTTWSSLKSLRDSSGLTPGRFYTITDYNTTTSQHNTSADQHQFDIMVLATNTFELSDVAWAVKHQGDNYFSGNSLSSWELKYCLDNDVNKFQWADNSSAGRGVIYYMKDEFGNEAPYDFKNIKFNVTYNSNAYTAYTFDINGIDASLAGYRRNVYSNIIKPAFDASGAISQQKLNEICFIVVDANIDKGDWYDNKFDENNHSMTFGHACYNNKFSPNCSNNKFGNGCNGNSFGVNCTGNTFGDECSINELNGHFENNTFGNSCSSNKFGNYCTNNTFDNSCWHNTFGNGCYSNSLSNNCFFNTLENGCAAIYLKAHCYYNVFGNGCYSIEFFKDYTYNTIVESNNRYITLTSSLTPTSANVLRNITIAQGVNYTSTTKTISHNTLNDTFRTVYKASGSNEVVI